MYVNLHSIWLETGFHLDAMDEFIQRLNTMDDVFVLPVHKALDWMRDPTPLTRIKDFAPWQCRFQPNQEDNEFCSFTFRPRTTTTTATRPPTTRRHHYNTHIDERGEDYSLHDGDRDHNGMRRDRGGGKGAGDVTRDGGKDRGGHDSGGGGGHKDHAHRPWFLRSAAGASGGQVSLTAVLCGVVSLVTVWVRT